MPKKKDRTIAFIQARIGSTRLPGKVLKEVLGQPLLCILWERIQAATSLDESIVLIPEDKSEDPLALFLEKRGIPYFRGKGEDVLDRFYQAALKYHPTSILRITADCPLIDPKKIDEIVSFFKEKRCDYASNTLERTFPKGMDLEVFSFNALKKAKEKGTTLYEKEHVTPYFYHHPEEFQLENIRQKEDNSSFRVTVDTEEDFKWVKKILSDLYPKNPLFTLEEVIHFCKRFS